MTQADTISVGDAVGHQRRDGVEAVEPAAGLIDRFTDVVSGEMLFELLLIFERVVPLCVGHGPGIEPTIDDFGHAAILPSIFGMGKVHFINGGSV